VEKIYKVLIGCANKSTKRASKQIESTQSSVKEEHTTYVRVGSVGDAIGF